MKPRFKRMHFWFYYPVESLFLMGLIGFLMMFAFTLGIHWGKRVPALGSEQGAALLHPVKTVPEKFSDIQVQTHRLEKNTKELARFLDALAHQEIQASGVHLEHPKPTQLPP